MRRCLLPVLMRFNGCGNRLRNAAGLSPPRRGPFSFGSAKRERFTALQYD